MSKKLTIGMFGFGVVGQGLYDIIKTKNLNLEIKKFVIKNANKKRSLPANLFTTDPNAIWDDPQINTVVELIDDPEMRLKSQKKHWNRGKMWCRPTRK